MRANWKSPHSKADRDRYERVRKGAPALRCPHSLHDVPSVSYQLPSHVRMCHTLRGAVFLDLKRNRYTGLPPAPSALLKQLLTASDGTQDEASAGAQALIRQLIGAGLIQESAGPPHILATSPLPASRLGFQQLAPAEASSTHALRFVRAYLWARFALHRRLWDVLDELNRLRARCSATRRDLEICAIARGFHRLRPYAFTARDQCLLHALALLHYLAASSVAATWVIGVQADPWGAHSWVQWNDIVLDATPEQTLAFTPILVA